MYPRLLLHLEGAAVLIASLFAYHWIHGNWLYFGLLFLAPDIAMLGYLASARAGAAVYNSVHTYIIPLALGGYAFTTNRLTLLSISLIWTAHIALDRLLGYGLKYPTRFNDTHLHPARHTF